MLPFNRVYTPQELQAMSRLTPVGNRTPVGEPGATRRPVGEDRGGALAALQRFFGRTRIRRSAPSTT